MGVHISVVNLNNIRLSKYGFLKLIEAQVEVSEGFRQAYPLPIAVTIAHCLWLCVCVTCVCMFIYLCVHVPACLCVCHMGVCKFLCLSVCRMCACVWAPIFLCVCVSTLSVLVDSGQKSRGSCKNNSTRPTGATSQQTTLCSRLYYTTLHCRLHLTTDYTKLH